MRANDSLWRLVLVLLLSGLLAACGTTKKARDDGRSIDYKTSKTAPKLEVPPDLTTVAIDDAEVIPSGSSIAISEYGAGRAAAGAASAGGTVMPEQANIRVERDGDRQWLVIEATPEQLWPVLRQFWTSNGFVLRLDEPALGIMETDWAENRADIPKGPVRKVIGKALDFAYSAATRDKFRVRLERQPPDGGTELFLTHRGMEEVIQGTPDEESSVLWRPRPSDPELEAEMLKRLMVRLGIQQRRAETLLAQEGKRAPKARIVEGEGGVTTLVLSDSFAPAWRRTGIALDRSGFVVEDRNRDQGLYFVRYDDPEARRKKGGWLSKLNPFAGKSGDHNRKYRIKLSGDGPETRVVVLDSDGQQDDSGTSRRIITLLHEQLK